MGHRSTSLILAECARHAVIEPAPADGVMFWPLPCHRRCVASLLPFRFCDCTAGRAAALIVPLGFCDCTAGRAAALAGLMDGLGLCIGSVMCWFNLGAASGFLAIWQDVQMRDTMQPNWESQMFGNWPAPFKKPIRRPVGSQEGTIV
jgi:hypothetical protein